MDRLSELLGHHVEFSYTRYTRKLWTGSMKKAAYPSG